MKSQILAGAAVLALIATADASAATKNAGAYAAPSQPVAYAKLGSYLKASPTKRAKQDWSIGSTATASAAPTGATANTAAIAPQTATPDTSAAGPAPSAPVASPAADSQTAAPAAPVQAPSDPMSAPAAPATPPASDTPPAAPATPGT